MNQKKFFTTKINIDSPEKAEQLRDRLDNMIWSVVGTANQCAAVATIDAFDAIEDAGLLKKEVKLNAVKCAESFETYYRKARGKIHDRFPLWADMVNIAANQLRPCVNDLLTAVQNVIDKHDTEVGYKDNIPSSLKAQVFTSMALIDVAVNLFDEFVRVHQSQTAYDIKREFLSARLSKAKHHWEIVTHHFSHTKGTVDLNKDKVCMIAINNLMESYQSTDFINYAAGEAMRLNPETKKYLKKEEIERIYGTNEEDTTQSESKE